MKKYKPIIVSICILILLNINIAYAKCPVAIYKIKGAIVSNDNVPIQNAFITIFFDKEENGITGISSENGDFEIKSVFDSEKETFFRDICSKTPSAITVIVYKEKYLSKRVSLKVKEINKEDYLFTLPSIPLIEISSTTLDLLK
jgi:hypothetical protein